MRGLLLGPTLHIGRATQLGSADALDWRAEAQLAPPDGREALTARLEAYA
jgi:hypothetical protein